MKIDFLNDWKDYLLHQIRSAGYEVDASQPVDQINYLFVNIQRRTVTPAPRAFHQARALICPPEHQAGFDALKAKILAGEDITPHLSKTLLRTNYEDDLLNDWGIHHFHLGQAVKSGFVERTGPLLFAVILDDAVYAINVYKHGDWTKQSMLQIAYENWPELLERYRVKGVVGMARSLSDDDIKSLRAGHVNTFIELGPDLVFMGMGGGQTTAGTSTQARVRADQMLRMVSDVEDHVRAHSDVILEEIRANGMTPDDDPEYKLLVGKDGLYVEEINSSASCLIYPFTAQK